MPFVGTGHIYLIAILLIIVLVIWGPGKLPEVGAGMGQALRQFRKVSAETKSEFSRATAPDAAPAGAPATSHAHTEETGATADEKAAGGRKLAVRGPTE